jgi:hypothetical protein
MRIPLGRSPEITMPRAVALALVSVGLVGCSDPTLVGNACQPGVTATVNQTTPPTFDWTPVCDVGTVLVTTEAGDLVWQLNSDPLADGTPTNGIHGGVVYGVAPPNAHTFGDPPAPGLVPGAVYAVYLNVIDSQGRDTNVGGTTFSIAAP